MSGVEQNDLPIDTSTVKSLLKSNIPVSVILEYISGGEIDHGHWRIWIKHRNDLISPLINKVDEQTKKFTMIERAFAYIKKLGFKDYKVNFDELRKEVLETAPNFSGINELPKKSVIKTNNIETSFFSEKIFVRELDYYYTNSISRSSKTMSECRQIRQKIKKDGTNN